MDDKLRGRKVKEVADEIVKDTMRMSEDVPTVNNEDFYDFGYERVLDFIMEHGRSSIAYRQIVGHSKKLFKEFIRKEKAGQTYFVDELSRRFCEDNDSAFEHIRERLLEKMDETDFDDISKRNWEEWASTIANEYYWS